VSEHQVGGKREKEKEESVAGSKFDPLKIERETMPLPELMNSSRFEDISLFIADAGPFVTYYLVGSFATRAVACYVAAGVGVLGSSLDFTNSTLNPGHRPWPRLLNTAEMVVYASMGILFELDNHCKMW
jgi:hypothetical protein